MDAGNLRNAIELLLLVAVTLIGIGRWLEREVTSTRVAELERWRNTVETTLAKQAATDDATRGDVASLHRRHHDQTVPWMSTTDRRLMVAERDLSVHEQRLDRAEHDIEGLQAERRK